MIDLDDDRWRAARIAVTAPIEGRAWDKAQHPREPSGKFAHVPGLDLVASKGKRKGISHNTITAKQWGQKVGHIRLTGEGTEIDDLTVSPKHRGKGIAHKLMQEAIDKFGHQTIRLHASPFGSGGLDAESLQAFYAKHGFVPEPDRGKGYMVRHPGGGRSIDLDGESRTWDEALHPRAPEGSASGGQFMAYDKSKNQGTGYGKQGGDASVRELQEALNKLGFTDAKGNKLEVDGQLGPLTTAAIMKAQKQLGVKPDGKVDKALLDKILKMKGGHKPSGPVAHVDHGKQPHKPTAHQDHSGGQPHKPAAHEDHGKTKPATHVGASESHKGAGGQPAHKAKPKHHAGPTANVDHGDGKPKAKPKPVAKKKPATPPKPVYQHVTVRPGDRSEWPDSERKAKHSTWDEAEHPRDPDGKFGDGVPGPVFDFGGSEDIDLDLPPSGPVFSPTTPKPKGPVKKGKKAVPKKTAPRKDVPGPIFSPQGDDSEIDNVKPSGPVFSFQGEEPSDLGPAPGPVFSPMGDEPPDLGGAPEPPAEPADSPRRKYGTDFVHKTNQQEGPKDYTDLPGDWEMDRVDKIESNYNWFENLPPHQQQTVRDTISGTSKKPTYVRMMPYGLGQTTRDGRMKNVHETRSKDDRYLDQRSDYEREVMGVDPSTPDEYKPIYGYVGDIETADAYGPVAVKLKPDVRKRTTATVGDSLNALSQPYGVDKLPDLSHDQLMGNIYGGVNVQNHLPHGSIFDYMEAQIHGGVSLDDIDEVHVDLEHGETLDDLFEPETLATLRDRGIPVIAREPNLGITPEQLAKLKGGH